MIIPMIIVVVDADADVDDDDDDDDDDPVELFQKRGKWWEGVDRNHSIGIYLYIIISNWDQTYLIQLSYILIIEFIKFWKSAHFHLSTDDHPTDPRLVAWPWRHCEPNSTPLRGPWPLHPAPQTGSPSSHLRLLRHFSSRDPTFPYFSTAAYSCLTRYAVCNQQNKSPRLGYVKPAKNVKGVNEGKWHSTQETHRDGLWRSIYPCSWGFPGNWFRFLGAPLGNSYKP